MKFYQDKRFYLPILIFLGVEVCFQLGLYSPLLRVKSYAANVNRITNHVLEKQNEFEPNALILGTSVAYQGLSVRILNQILQKQNVKLQSIAIPGSELIVQHLATKKVLQKLKKVKLLIHVMEVTMPWVQKKNIMLPTMAMVSELDSWGALWNLERFGYNAKFSDYSYIAVKTIAYRRDLKDLFLDPGSRIKKLGRKWRKTNKNYYEYENQIKMRVSNFYPLKNLQECIQKTNPANGQPLPPGSDKHHKKAIWDTCALAGITNKERRVNELTKLYFKRLKLIYDMLKSKNIRIVNVFAPYSNLLESLGGEERMQVWRSELQRLNGKDTIIIDLQNIIDTERNGDYCYDLIHLNGKGMQLFSQRLGEELQKNTDLWQAR
ncbi:MAG: SGNH/GDSL hydrolase family protein [Spirochaetota bacterium]